MQFRRIDFIRRTFDSPKNSNFITSFFSIKENSKNYNLLRKISEFYITQQPKTKNGGPRSSDAASKWMCGKFTACRYFYDAKMDVLQNLHTEEFQSIILNFVVIGELRPVKGSNARMFFQAARTRIFPS